MKSKNVWFDAMIKLIYIYTFTFLALLSFWNCWYNITHFADVCLFWSIKIKFIFPERLKIIYIYLHRNMMIKYSSLFIYMYILYAYMCVCLEAYLGRSIIIHQENENYLTHHLRINWACDILFTYMRIENIQNFRSISQTIPELEQVQNCQI